MIFSRQVLFVHVPKTGGMAATRFLLSTLPRPVWFTHPDRNPPRDPGVVRLPGIRHETLAESVAIAAEQGVDALALPLIFGVIRNPYVLEVSRFAYLQKGHPWDAGRNQELALAGDFTAFAIGSSHHGGTQRPIESYFELAGRMPQNLRILRQESLGDELPAALRAAGVEVPEAMVLAAENESRHGFWRDYYTRAAAEAVEARYRWIFDHGFYDRLDHATLPEHRDDASPDPSPDPPHGSAVATSGPIRQVGPTVGLWHDGWAERRVSVPLVADADVATLTIQGRVPRAFPAGLHLTVSAGSATSRREIATTGSFTVAVSAPVVRGDRFCLAVDASASFCPRDHGSADTRELAFVLDRITAG